MSQRRRSRGHLTAASSTGSSVLAAQSLPLVGMDPHPPTTDGSVWGRRRVLLLNSTYEPLAALPRPTRGHHAAVWQGRRRARRSDRSRDPFRHPSHRVAVGDQASLLRAGALPGASADDQGGADAPRPVPLRVLRIEGRHRRPRGAAQPRWRTFLGELRGGVRQLQPPQGRPAACRAGLGAAVGPAPAKGAALATAVVGEGTRPRVGAIPG